MRKFLFFKKKEHPSAPLWSKKVSNYFLQYDGGDVENFLSKFDRIEDEIIALWNGNKLNWSDYQRNIAEVEEARQLFVRFAYN